MKILFKERLSGLMKEYGYNQGELANRSGVKQNTISAWLKDKKQPGLTSLWLIADCFDVSIDYLVDRKDELAFGPPYI